MANNTNQMLTDAVQAFCIVPEIYQKIAREKYQSDIPDDYVTSVKGNGKAVMEELMQGINSGDQNATQLAQGLLQIYKENMQEIQNAVQQTGMFKKGGKLDQLVQKCAKGDKVDKKKKPTRTATNTASGRRVDGVAGEWSDVSYSDGTRDVTLTRDGMGGYPAVSTVSITPAGDTVGTYQLIAPDAKVRKFGTQANYNTYQTQHPGKKVPFSVFPSNWIPAFLRNTGFNLGK